LKKKKDYRTPVAVDGQNVAFSHGEFINKQNKRKERFFSYQGLIDLAQALNKNDFRPVIFLPNYWIIAKIMEKNMQNVENPLTLKREIKKLLRKKEIRFLKCKWDADDPLIMKYAYDNKCGIISNDTNFLEHTENYPEEEKLKWKEWLFHNVHQYDYEDGYFKPWNRDLIYHDIEVDYDDIYHEDYILLDGDVDVMFRGDMSNFY